MKALSLITIFTAIQCISLNANAQVQLYPDDVYSRGKFQYSYDTTGGFNLGSAGANQTWDFSNLKSHYGYESYVTGYKGSIPEVNLVEISDSDTMNYFQKTDQSLSMIIPLQEFESTGYGKLRMLSFPLDYLDENKDSLFLRSYFTGKDFGMPTIDSIRLTFRLIVKTKSDAWGTIKIPSGNYDALRIWSEVRNIAKLEGKTSKTNYISIPGFDQDEVEQSYRWYAKGKGNYLASYMVADDEMEFMSSSLNIKPTVKISDLKVNNPFSNELKIMNGSTDNFQISLVNLNGSQLTNAQVAPNNTYVFNTSNLNEGLYYLQIVNLNTKSVSFQKVIKK